MANGGGSPDHFERLGLPRRFAVDARQLEQGYLARSREVHPDFHQLGAGGEQLASLELSAALNDAYRTLRDPFRRAEYLLGLEGGPSAAELKEMGPAFLEEMLDLRMQIEELRGEPTESPQRAAMEGELAARHGRLLGEVAGRFAEAEALPAGDPSRPALLRQVRRLLNEAKYVQGLLRDLRAD